MDRNLYRRIEIMYPILDPGMKQRLIRDLDTYLADNTEAWELNPAGTYRHTSPRENENAISAQSTLLRELSEAP